MDRDIREAQNTIDDGVMGVWWCFAFLREVSGDNG